MAVLAVGTMVDPALEAEICRVATEAYKAVGCRDYARVDMRIEDGIVYILEVNPNPDLADGCAFAQCVRASGRTYAQAMEAAKERVAEFAEGMAERTLH